MVLTQYKSHSLDRHITKTWRMSTLLGNYVTPVPAQQRLGPRWFAGSADAIYQSLNLINDEQPDYVIVFGADHIYRMDPQQMVAEHIDSGAGVTVAGIRQPLSTGRPVRRHRGRPTDGRRIPAFREKPTDAVGLPDAPDEVYASMGNYVFTTEALVDALRQRRAGPGEQARHGRQHHPDAGRARRGATSTTSATTTCPGSTDRDRGYWRDVGTLDSFYDAHMDLIAIHPVFNLYNYEWPIYTDAPSRWPPAKFVHGWQERVGRAVGSMVSPGAVDLRRAGGELGRLARTCRCTRGPRSRARC